MSTSLCALPVEGHVNLCGVPSSIIMLALLQGSSSTLVKASPNYGLFQQGPLLHGLQCYSSWQLPRLTAIAQVHCTQSSGLVLPDQSIRGQAAWQELSLMLL